MHIAIVGAGAIGCFLAARLSGPGRRVTLVGRLEQVEAITRDGLLVHDRRNGTRRYRIPAVTMLEERPDLALLTVKTQDLAQACTEIRPHISGVPVVTMQNGVQADEIAAGVLGRDAVAGAVVMCAATYLQPGQMSVEFPGWLIVGEPFGPSQRRTRAIASLLNRAVPTFHTDHLAAVRWSKLISNLNNALCAATGLLLTEITATPPGRVLPVRVMREGYQVARQAGVHLDHGLYGLTPRAIGRDPSAALIALLQATMTPMLATLPQRAAADVLGAASHSRLNRLPIRGSTWQSLARGRSSEVDYLNGEIVRLGERLKVPTPYNSHLVDLVHRVEQSHSFYPLEALQPPDAAPASAPSPAGAMR